MPNADWGPFSELFLRELLMHVGKTLFAQLMDFLPWTTFQRLVNRYDGNRRARTLTCAEQFRAMAFAQRAYRESVRDIEVCLSSQPEKFYHMGFRKPVERPTLADANERRDWHIFADFAQVLIRQARAHYASDVLDIDIDAMVYALDSTTIDLCLALFDGAPFRSAKAAIKLHTLIDLHGSIPSFIHIYVLVAIVKKRLQLDAALYTLLQILSVTLFEKMPINKALSCTRYTSESARVCKQLNLP